MGTYIKIIQEDAKKIDLTNALLHSAKKTEEDIFLLHLQTKTSDSFEEKVTFNLFISHHMKLFLVREASVGVASTWPPPLTMEN